MPDEIEPTQGEIEHQNKYQDEYPSWGNVGQIGELGSGGQSGGGHFWYTISPIWYAISPIWYAIPLSGIPSPISGIHLPIWYPIPLMSHQSGILHSLIFFILTCLIRPQGLPHRWGMLKHGFYFLSDKSLWLVETGYFYSLDSTWPIREKSIV